MNYKDLLRALSSIEDERNISKDIVIDALKEALTKAYRKNVELPDIYVKVDIDETTGKIHLYQQYKVVENVEDEELEISLEDARAINQNAQYDDFIDEEKPIDQLSRASATLARNVMKQKIREAQKSAIYDEYIDQLDEMVLGFIETVEEKFTLVNLGKTIAMMPKGAQIPNERLVEGQKTRVVITAVNKDTKGSQVLVSRADAKLVRRLFEKEVPEIYDGIVEIKAIAREAGERTKMAVYSNNPDVDPIGACIGQRGQRVQTIIDELCGEKIDIFEWSENITDLVKNALAPAEVLAVIPAEDNKGLTVVVDASQLSLAIGKKGKNARLAVKLTGHKIDIKTRQELDDLGVDYIALMREYEIVQEKERRERAAAELARLRAEAEAEAQAAREAALAAAKARGEEEIEEYEPEFEDTYVEEVSFIKPEPVKEPEKVEEPVKAEEPVNVEPVKEVEPEPVVKRKAKKLEKKTDEYVSKFEKLAEVNKPAAKADTKKKKKKEEDDHKVRAKELLKDKEYDIRPVYSEEELEEIRLREEMELDAQYADDVDYDEYDEYYDDMD